MLKEMREVKLYQNKKILFIIILALAFLVIAGILITKNPENNSSNFLGKECTKDSDCVKQLTTCCGCNMGGAEICMPKANSTFYQNKLANECNEARVCAQVYLCQNTSCLCQNGFCNEQ